LSITNIPVPSSKIDAANTIPKYIVALERKSIPLFSPVAAPSINIAAAIKITVI